MVPAFELIVDAAQFTDQAALDDFLAELEAALVVYQTQQQGDPVLPIAANAPAPQVVANSELPNGKSCSIYQ